MALEALSLSPSSATQQACCACGQVTCFCCPIFPGSSDGVVPVNDRAKIKKTSKGVCMHTDEGNGAGTPKFTIQVAAPLSLVSSGLY